MLATQTCWSCFNPSGEFTGAELGATGSLEWKLWDFWDSPLLPCCFPLTVCLILFLLCSAFCGQNSGLRAWLLGKPAARLSFSCYANESFLGSVPRFVQLEVTQRWAERGHCSVEFLRDILEIWGAVLVTSDWGVLLPFIGWGPGMLMSLMGKESYSPTVRLWPKLLPQNHTPVLRLNRNQFLLSKFLKGAAKRVRESEKKRIG